MTELPPHEAVHYAGGYPPESADWQSLAPSGDDERDLGVDQPVEALPFRWRSPDTIPERGWLLGRWLLRGTLCAAVAPGGVGKSTFMAGMVMSLATGLPLLGKQVIDGPQRVWLWNLEDDRDELDRQLHAAALHHRLKQEDFESRIFCNSGLDDGTLCTAIEDAQGFRLLKPVYENLLTELLKHKIDVLVVDPFVSSHKVSENANEKVDAIAKEWARVARAARATIVLVHHTPKLHGVKVTAEMSRGAVALPNAARSCLVFNRMSNDEAEQFGIIDDDERRRYFSVQDDKHNRAPAEKADWFRLHGVWLKNDPQNQWGDNVGAVESWTPPDASDGIDKAQLRRIQVRFGDEPQWRENVQAKNTWAGIPIAQELELDLDDPTDKKRVKMLLKRWTGSVLKRVVRTDDKGKDRPFLVAGDRIE